MFANRVRSVPMANVWCLAPTTKRTVVVAVWMSNRIHVTAVHVAMPVHKGILVPREFVLLPVRMDSASAVENV